MRVEIRLCAFVLFAAASGLAVPPRVAAGPAHVAAAAARARAVAAPARAEAASIAGWWRGHADFRGARLELAVHFEAAGAGLRATLDCPDMMVLEQPLDSVTQSGRRVRFATPDAPSLAFDCVLAGDTLRGGAVAPAVGGVIERSREAAGTIAIALGRARPPAAPPY